MVKLEHDYLRRWKNRIKFCNFDICGNMCSHIKNIQCPLYEKCRGSGNDGLMFYEQRNKLVLDYIRYFDNLENW